MEVYKNDTLGTQFVRKKHYGIRLDAVLLTMIKIFPNELADFNSKLLMSNLENTSFGTSVIKGTAHFWHGGLPCTKYCRTDDVSVTELMDYSELDKKHLKQNRCLTFPAEALDNVCLEEPTGPLSVRAVMCATMEVERHNKFVYINMFQALASGQWKGYRVLGDRAVDSDDSDAGWEEEVGADDEYDPHGDETEMRTRHIKRVCLRPADSAEQAVPQYIDDDDMVDPADWLGSESDTESQKAEYERADNYREHGYPSQQSAANYQQQQEAMETETEVLSCTACDANLPFTNPSHVCEMSSNFDWNGFP